MEELLKYLDIGVGNLHRLGETCAQLELEPLTQALQTAQADLIERINLRIKELATKVDACTELLEEAHRSTDELTQTVQSNVSRWVGHFETMDNHLNAFADQHEAAQTEAAEALATWQAESEELIESVRAYFENLEEQIAELISESINHISETVSEPVEEALEARCQAIEEYVQHIVDEMVPEALERFSTEWQGELKAELDELLDLLRSALGDLRQTLFASEEDAAGGRSQAEGSLATLQSAFDPILGSLARVKGLASTVGIAI